MISWRYRGGGGASEAPSLVTESKTSGLYRVNNIYLFLIIIVIIIVVVFFNYLRNTTQNCECIIAITWRPILRYIKRGGRPAIIILDCSLHQVIPCSKCTELKRSENARSLSQLHSCLLLLLAFLVFAHYQNWVHYLSRRMISSLTTSC